MKRIDPQYAFLTFILLLGTPIFVKVWSFYLGNLAESDAWFGLTFWGVLIYLGVYHAKFRVRIHTTDDHRGMAKQKAMVMHLKEYIQNAPANHICHDMLDDLTRFAKLGFFFGGSALFFFFYYPPLILFFLDMSIISFLITFILADNLRYYMMKEMGIPQTRDGHFLL